MQALFPLRLLLINWTTGRKFPASHGCPDKRRRVTCADSIRELRISSIKGIIKLYATIVYDKKRSVMLKFPITGRFFVSAYMDILKSSGITVTVDWWV